MKKNVCPTPGFETLLVATDGSGFSAAAVQEAVNIAAACSSTLIVMHVFEVSAEVELWDAHAAEKLEGSIRKYLAGIKAKAAKRKVSAIVMGSHGRTGLTRLMMGSTVSRVIGHAPCKVLVVPVKAKRR